MKGNTMNTNTVQKAIELLDAATSTLNIDRQKHQAIVKSLQIFRDVMNDNEQLRETIKELNKDVLLYKAENKAQATITADGDEIKVNVVET